MEERERPELELRAEKVRPVATAPEAEEGEKGKYVRPKKFLEEEELEESLLVIPKAKVMLVFHLVKYSVEEKKSVSYPWVYPPPPLYCDGDLNSFLILNVDNKGKLYHTF